MDTPISVVENIPLNIIKESVGSFEEVLCDNEIKEAPHDEDIKEVPDNVINSETLSNNTDIVSINNINMEIPLKDNYKSYNYKCPNIKVLFNETYVIFLPEFYFTYSWYSYKYYSKIIKNLKNKGVAILRKVIWWPRRCQ